jgi:hypothetical protein
LTSRLKIFVSVGPDLEMEREVVGKAIAELPLSVGWVIKHTPLARESADPTMEEVATCDFYSLLLGADITAPVGAELHVARKAGKRIVAFLKEVPRTPAAYVFVKHLSEEWQRFAGERELKRLFQRALIDQILERPEHHGITVADWEALSLLSAELADETLLESREEASPRRGGAGSDAVIVAPGRDVPAGGVLIEKKEGSS